MTGSTTGPRTGEAAGEPLHRAAEVLSRATTVAMACHVNPDADALGSMLGLAAFLRGRGVQTICSFPNEPLEPPRWASLLPGIDGLVEAAEFPREPEVMVTCDCASADRLGRLQASADRAKELIWIDHHRSNDGLGTIPLIDPDASSTCEMVYRLISVMGGDMPDETALCLYAGLVTDTGKFQYEATRPETLRIAAELREHDFDHTALVQALYEDNRREYLSLVGIALGRMAFVPEADLIWTYLTQSDLTGAGVHAQETDDLIDVIRTARDVDVAAVLKQMKDGRFKVSARSRGDHDLAAVAATFGGGGHRLAAGYTSDHGPADTIERLVAALRGDPVAP
jgi:bifunctional oligoribonuclease and PAP phosphatase NrnA